MKVYCLTLPRHKHRIATIKRDWEGWDLEFVYGVDYLDCPSVGYDRLFGILGCMLGHFRIWEKLEDEWNLVIEDDSKPLLNIYEAVEQVTNCPYELVKLYHNSGRELTGIHYLKHNEWVSTSCYMIRNRCAKRLLKEVWLSSPDAFLHKYTEPYGFFPIAAYFPDEAKTTIPYEGNRNIMRKPDELHL